MLLLLILSLLAPAAFAAPGSTHPPAHPPALLVLGDSLSAGFGTALDQGWVSLLEQRLADQGLPYQVVNASISGDTTAGGLSRLPALLAEYRPAVVIIELGANDGLRGFPPKRIAAALEDLTQQAQAAGARVLLVGVRLPPNYGSAYAEQFQAVYAQVAAATGAALVPRLLDGVAEDRALMQADGLHPTAVAQPRLLDNVWPVLLPLLHATGGGGG